MSNARSWPANPDRGRRSYQHCQLEAAFLAPSQGFREPSRRRLRGAQSLDTLVDSPDFSQKREPFMRHVLSAVVQNVPGVLAHVAGMLASRGYNIDSLAVGETEDPQLSRMTFVVVGDDSVLEQVRKQLEKIVTVVRVSDVSSKDFVERDLMLIKVEAKGEDRTEIRELTKIFRGRIVDVSPSEVVVEISGQESKVEAFIDLMRPFGIRELVRTGRIAMVRSIDRPQRGGNIRPAVGLKKAE